MSLSGAATTTPAASPTGTFTGGPQASPRRGVNARTATTLLAGIKATATRLVVTGLRNDLAGAQVYNRFSGEFLAQFAPLRSQIVNDVAIAPNGNAYLSGFTRSKIFWIPAADLNRQPEVQRLQVSSTSVEHRSQSKTRVQTA